MGQAVGALVLIEMLVNVSAQLQLVDVTQQQLGFDQPVRYEPINGLFFQKETAYA